MNGKTIASSAQVAGSFAAEKRAEGLTVTVTTVGSDDKRGTRPTFIVEWSPEVIDGTQEPFEQTPTRVDQSYDRHTRSWITVVLDENGFQIGDAAYDGNRADAAASLASAERKVAK